ncbi:hypothetical protein D3C87_2124300 [compost metagenome]
MLTTECVGCHKVDLWTVERRFPFLLEVLEFICDNCILQLLLSRLPQRHLAKVAVAIVAVTKTNPKLHVDSLI